MNPLPEEVKRFVDRNIDSVEQLELLRVLGEDPDREWSATALAREVQARAIEPSLAALHGRGLLSTVRRGAEVFYRSAPATPELAGELSRLLQAYRERPVSMINLVYARSKKVLETFAEAFRFKKEG